METKDKRRVISDRESYNPLVKGYKISELPWESGEEPDYPHILLTRKDVGRAFQLDGMDFQLIRFNKRFTLKLAAAEEEKIYHWMIYLVCDGKIFRPSNYDYHLYYDDPLYLEKKFHIGCVTDSIWHYSPQHQTKSDYYIVE